jgi:hypothetical protein
MTADDARLRFMRIPLMVLRGAVDAAPPDATVDEVADAIGRYEAPGARAAAQR